MNATPRREPARAGSGAGGFRVPAGQSQAAGETATTAAATPLGSLEALLAVQGLPDPLERRRRAVRRGTGLLDQLDELKLALLDGSLPPSVLRGLRAELATAREADDVGLDQVLAEIETRALVELAKLERAAA